MDNYTLSNADVPRSIGEGLLEFFCLFMVGVVMVLSGGGVAFAGIRRRRCLLVAMEYYEQQQQQHQESFDKDVPNSTINRSDVIVFT